MHIYHISQCSIIQILYIHSNFDGLDNTLTASYGYTFDVSLAVLLLEITLWQLHPRDNESPCHQKEAINPAPLLKGGNWSLLLPSDFMSIISLCLSFHLIILSCSGIFLLSTKAFVCFCHDSRLTKVFKQKLVIMPHSSLQSINVPISSSGSR